MFRFLERWQASVATTWRRSLPDNAELFRLLELRDQQLEDFLNADPPWTEITTFSNSWVNYGSGHREARILRVGARRWLEASLKGGTLNAVAIPLGDVDAPPQILRFPTADSGVAQIDTSGNVALYAASNTIQSFNISWSVTP